ncbi:MAG: hypothetical protein C4523_10295 [Myxococcales bacterium]|nr:MAG: hypothetical protein C4523_10295 [Myxococcales bacterium]
MINHTPSTTMTPDLNKRQYDAELIRDEVRLGLLPPHPTAEDIQQRNCMNPLTRAQEALIATDPSFARCFVDVKNWKPNRPGYRLVRIRRKGCGPDTWQWIPDRTTTHDRQAER